VPSKKARTFNYDWKGIGVRKGANDQTPSLLEIGTKNQKLLANLKWEAYITLISFLHWQFICRYDNHSAQEPGSLTWCCAVMRLQFTNSAALPICRGKLGNGRADCSTVGLYCATITWQRHVFPSSYGSRECWTQVMQGDSRMQVLNASNAGRQWVLTEQGYSIILRKSPVKNVKTFRGPVTPIKSCKCDMSSIFLTKKNIMWEFNTVISRHTKSGKWTQILTKIVSVFYSSAGRSNGILCFLAVT